MKYFYTATFIPTEDGTEYYCRVPDLPGCITTGDSLENAIDLITDAASGWLVIAEDENIPIPTQTPQSQLDTPSNAILSIIQIDTTAYRATNELDSLQKDMAIPA